MATVSVGISDTLDDGSELPGVAFQTGSLAAGFISGVFEGNAFLRFLAVTGPTSGATINTATITLNITAIAGTPNTTVFGVDVDDAAAFSDPGNLPSAAAKTTASSDGDPAGTGTQTINVVTQVQEIINRAGWASGNDMAFVWDDNAGSGSNSWTAEDFQAAGTAHAVLDIDYTNPSNNVANAGYFGRRYFAGRFFAPRYFGNTAAAGTGTTVTPTTASLTTATFASQLRMSVPVGAQSLITTKFAAQLRERLTVGNASLSLATFAPEAGLGPYTATPTTLALLTAAFAPQLRERVPVGLAQLATTMFTAQLRESLTPSTLALLTETFAPDVQFTEHAFPTPDTASLVLTSFAPQLRERLTATTAALVLATFAPLLATVINGAAPTALETTTFAPQLREVLRIALATLVLESFEPDAALGPLTVTPDLAELVLTTFAPIIATSEDGSVTPETASLILTAFALQLREQLTVGLTSLLLASFTPQLMTRVPVGAAALSLTTFAATLRESLSPGPASLVLATFASQLRTRVTPSQASLVTTRFAAQLRERVVPTTRALSTATFAPSLLENFGIVPSPASLVTVRFAPQLRELITPGPAGLVTVTFPPVIPGGTETIVIGLASLLLTGYAPDLIIPAPSYSPGGPWPPRNRLYLHQIEQKLIRDRSNQ